MAKKNPAATAEDLTLDSALDGGDTDQATKLVSVAVDENDPLTTHGTFNDGTTGTVHHGSEEAATDYIASF